ncbi:flagellar biosynthesis protein FlhF [Paenibacillus massiliensis]|uniref:flagellar biosynthesis protein FlhF n=1 Tax=Paenibacillus massiliensis TaxID=225917 RepID=UPI0003FE8DC8|nr:flagellar biosynthesis protein FlhF [Paenibacillus massiliensis]
MRVKRYIVNTMPEAMQQIREDLGSNAVILSTKPMKTGGFLGMFRQRKIEVIAALEKEADSSPRINTATIARPAEKLFMEEEQPPRPVTVPRSAAPNAYRRAAEDYAPPQPRPNTEQQVRANDIQLEQSVPQAKVSAPFSEAQMQELLAVAGHRAVKNEPPAYAEVSTADQSLLEEIREMKLMMTRLSRSAVTEPQLPEPAQRICERLIEQDVDRELLDDWLEMVYQQRDRELSSASDFDWEQAFRELLKGFIDQRIGGGIELSTRIIYVAGPTGVGKTTTIAKLAAEQLFRFNRKVGLITSDTYRISAVDQLRTYASILNVPLEIVQSPSDLHRAMQRLEACDLILMDTAGRNYRNELLVSELQSLLAHREDSETYLVLSLTSKSKDMKTIAQHFSQYHLDKVIFTKADETGSIGAMFNLLHEYPLKISYMTNGQNVPEDVFLPDTKRLLNMLLGEST